MAVKNLETLNLGYNNITNEGVHRLKDGLLKNRSILRLGMQSTKVGQPLAWNVLSCTLGRERHVVIFTMARGSTDSLTGNA